MLDPSFVSRNLRVAISEWYSWLSDKSIKQDEWRSVPHWCKRVPSRLDIPWALEDLDKRKDNRQLIRALFVVVDELYLASIRMEGVPSIERLRNHLLEWHEEEYG